MKYYLKKLHVLCLHLALKWLELTHAEKTRISRAKYNLTAERCSLGHLELTRAVSKLAEKTPSNI